MTLRELCPEDWPEVRELYRRQGWEYELPEAVLTGSVAVDEAGRVVMAVLARPTVELYLLSDPDWKTPRWRWQALLGIQQQLQQQLRQLGIRDAHLWCPPQLEKSFGRRLIRFLGWRKSQWPCFSREV